jgi:DNA-binding Lrp family transcriptional regulator
VNTESLQLDDIDKRLLDTVQKEFPLDKTPLRTLGELLNISEDELILRFGRLQELGIIRRIGPILDMRRLGFKGVLVALPVPEKRIDEVSDIINEYMEVSHNYLRPNETDYNLWFTISASEDRIRDILDDIKEKTGLRQLVLPTCRIFKIGVKFDID